MSPTPVKRKLVAILAADAVGYSRMMAADEEGTVRILSAHRAVIDGIIEFHEGRIINTAGDSVLAEFASPVQAVRCAVEIQDALETRNESLSEGQRMHFRIGVNLGDVMVKGDDLLGDGVNVAARLEGIAEPGMIYIASSVYDQIAGKLNLGFVDLGNQSLKNIDRPIRAYRIERGGMPAPTPAPRSRTGLWIGVIAAAVLVAGALGWRFGGRAPEAPVPQAPVAVAPVAPPPVAPAPAATRPAAAPKVVASPRPAPAPRPVQPAPAPRPVQPAPAPRPAQPTPAPAPAPVAVSAPPRSYQGNWQAVLTCKPFAKRPAFAHTIPMTVTDGKFNVQHGAPGGPESYQLSGTPDASGRLHLAGDGFGGAPTRRLKSGQPFRAEIDGRFDGPRYQGNGQFGAQECALQITRAP
jgi:adenylate cyclase